LPRSSGSSSFGRCAATRGAAGRGIRPVKAIQLASDNATITLTRALRHVVRALGNRQPNDRNSAKDATTPTSSPIAARIGSRRTLRQSAD
jgi:hypothetical protein